MHAWVCRYLKCTKERRNCFKQERHSSAQENQGNFIIRSSTQVTSNNQGRRNEVLFLYTFSSLKDSREDSLYLLQSFAFCFVLRGRRRCRKFPAAKEGDRPQNAQGTQGSRGLHFTRRSIVVFCFAFIPHLAKSSSPPARIFLWGQRRRENQ